MKWISDFQLFLFDFDGLLVNTEHLHLQAYTNALAKRGLDLGWGLSRFWEVAHLSSSALKEAICSQFPEIESEWRTLYEEKKQAYLALIATGKVELMPGVERLLKALEKAKKRRCVVTNSFYEQIAAIRTQVPVLQTIPKWITREDYAVAKPSPESYLRAIELYGEPGDKIIGFEDSVRGIQALAQTPATPVLICPSHYPLLELAVGENIIYYESFSDLPENHL